MVAGCGSDDRPERSGARRAAPPSTTSTTTTTAPVRPTADLVEAACGGGLVVTRGEPVDQPLLAEVSGLAITELGADGYRAWVLNDSGDEARLYGFGAGRTSEVVTVLDAEHVDWEALAAVGGEDPHLWIGDVGDNRAERPTVQLYRVDVPRAGEQATRAERVDVTYPDGPHDAEAILADGSGAVWIVTKEPAWARVYRVDPPTGGGPATAVAVGELRPGDGPATTVTDAAVSPDGAAVVVRTYGGAWLYPVDPGQDPAAALVSGKDPGRGADGTARRERRCRAEAGAELQGEAVAFLPDGSGYVTIGEGTSPAPSTVTVRDGPGG